MNYHSSVIQIGTILVSQSNWVDIDGDSLQEQECTYSDGPHILVCGHSGSSDIGLLLQPGLDPRGQQAQGEGLSVV